MSGSGSSGSEPPRNPQNLQGLLRLCMETAEYEPQTSSSNERSQWLSEALQGMTTDVVQEMVKCVDVIKSGLNSVDTNSGLMSNETIADIESSIDTLIDYTGSIDNAGDFYTIGGFEIFKPLLLSQSDGLKSKGAELLAEVIQNHTLCQNHANEYHLLPILINILDNDDNDNNVRVKALYAISCLIRDNEESQRIFETKCDGFSVLLRAIQSNGLIKNESHSSDHKLRIKSAFLISNLCRQNPSFRDIIFNMGFVVQLVALLHTDHDNSHEHLLAALYALASQHEPSRNECQRSELGFENLLNDRIEMLKDKSEYTEEVDFCKALIQLCFNNNDFPESER